MTFKIQLNGEPFQAQAGLSVGALIRQLELRPARIAVELNRVVVPKAEFERRMLSDGDVVEIINFVGGG